jgi:hypothetical protein
MQRTAPTNPATPVKRLTHSFVAWHSIHWVRSSLCIFCLCSKISERIERMGLRLWFERNPFRQPASLWSAVPSRASIHQLLSLRFDGCSDLFAPHHKEGHRTQSKAVIGTMQDETKQFGDVIGQWTTELHSLSTDTSVYNLSSVYGNGMAPARCQLVDQVHAD